MATLIRYGDGSSDAVLIEVEDRSGPVTRGGRAADAIVDAGETLEDVFARLGPAVAGIVTRLREAAEWPAEVEVEFGVKLSADSNVIIARAGGEANFRIALRWSRDQ